MTKETKTETPPGDDTQQKIEQAAAMQLPAPDAAKEYEDLPDEVKKQLIGYEEIELENQLFDIVSTQSKSVITVDKVIVGLWHRHKKTVDRNKVLRTLNAMADDGRIKKHASPRGYSLPGVDNA